MRVAFALAAAVVVTACQVNVEGAPCAIPGTATDCPDGQACGNDLKCSEEAGSCVAAKTFCTQDTDLCRGNVPGHCAPSGACGRFTATMSDCGPLVCDMTIASPYCRCPTHVAGTEFAVDPANSAPPATGATGVLTPAQCRYGRLGDAIAAAVAHGGPTTVRAYRNRPQIVFDAETFPLVVPRAVTLQTSDDPASPANWLISAPAGTSDLIRVEDGAVLDGFSVATAAATGDGIVVQCGAGASVSPLLSNVVVDGGNTLRRGVAVEGACGLNASELRVSRASRAGLYVNTPAGAQPVTVTGGSLQSNGESGVEVVSGQVTLAGLGTAPLDVSGNKRHGIRASPDAISPLGIALTIGSADVHDNGEVGILVKDLVQGSSSVSISSTLIRKNSATAAYSQYGTGRLAGGVLLWGNLPTAAPFAFKGNTICANASDGVGVYSNDGWSLSGDAGCDATKNVFVMHAVSGYYVYSTTTGGDIPAQNNAWDPDPPTGLVMKASYVPSCGVPSVPAACN